MNGPSPSGLSRRDFLRRSLFGATACWTLPAFLGSAVEARAEGTDEPILILLQMTGGNDSLNTVIPYTNPTYLSERPNLRLTPQNHGAFAIGQAPALQGATTYNEAVALHPRLPSIRNAWDEGELAVINGVGYPNPNLSHFTAFDYYHTARPNEPLADGWLGRFFDHECAGFPPQTAVHLNDQPTLAMRSLAGSATSVATTDPRWLSWQYFNDRQRQLEDLFRRGVGIGHPVDDGISSSDATLAYVQRSAQAALLASREMQSRLSSGSAGFPVASFPATDLGKKFRDIAQLIKGGIAARIYYVEQVGYDTHGRQIFSGDDPITGIHSNLLTELDGALGAFVTEMKAQGNWNRVVILTFSEFGRKVNQNGSLGTDHGAAQTLFALGGQVQGGFHGAMPDLSPAARIKNNCLDFNVDFRRVYRTLLERWLGVPPSSMGAIFPSQPADFSLLSFL